MLRLICLLLAISLTLSSRIISKVSSALTIFDETQSSVSDVYQILYDTPKSTLYFSDISQTIYPSSILINPNNRGVRIYGVSYNNVINPLTRQTQQLSGSFQRPSQATQASKVKPPYIAYTAGVGSPITSNTDVFYQTSGLSWTTYYTLQLNSDETRADILGSVQIDNSLDKSFINTKLTLSTGKQSFLSYNLQNGFFQMVGKETAPGQQAYSSGKSYTLSQKVNISKGNDNFFDLFKMVKNVPVKKIFTATVEAGVARQEINFTTQYRIQNKKFYGLGESLPKGSGRIDKKNMNGEVTPAMYQITTEHVDPGMDITFKAGNSPSNLKSQYVRNGNRAQLKITNLASTPANIELKLISRKSTNVLYNRGYQGPRWEMGDGYWRTSTTIPARSTRSIQWNEFVDSYGRK